MSSLARDHSMKRSRKNLLLELIKSGRSHLEFQKIGSASSGSI